MLSESKVRRLYEFLLLDIKDCKNDNDKRSLLKQITIIGMILELDTSQVIVGVKEMMGDTYYDIIEAE